MKILFGLIEDTTEAKTIANSLFEALTHGKSIEAKDWQAKLMNKAISSIYLSETEWLDILRELRQKDEKFQADYILCGEQIRFLYGNKSFFPVTAWQIIDKAFLQNCFILELPVAGGEA